MLSHEQIFKAGQSLCFEKGQRRTHEQEVTPTNLGNQITATLNLPKKPPRLHRSLATLRPRNDQHISRVRFPSRKLSLVKPTRRDLKVKHLSALFQPNQVLDALSFDEPSTKAARELLGKMEVGGPVLLVLTEDDTNAALSFRNLPEVTVVGPYEYGVYELLRAREVVFSRAAYSRISGEGE